MPKPEDAARHSFFIQFEDRFMFRATCRPGADRNAEVRKFLNRHYRSASSIEIGGRLRIGLPHRIFWGRVPDEFSPSEAPRQRRLSDNHKQKISAGKRRANARLKALIKKEKKSP